MPLWAAMFWQPRSNAMMSLMFAAGAAFTLAVVQQGPKPPAEVKQFDFWVGSWKCSGESYDAAGKASHTEGKNTITRSFDGFVIQEDFHMLGFHGMSVSVFDPNAKLWRQTWVDNGGSYIALTGKFEDGKMTLQTLPRPKAPNSANRMIFSNIKKDSFDWDWEATTDGGKSWKLQWRLHYTRA
jgi:hypothetical protein